MSTPRPYVRVRKAVTGDSLVTLKYSGVSDEATLIVLTAFPPDPAGIDRVLASYGYATDGAMLRRGLGWAQWVKPVE